MLLLFPSTGPINTFLSWKAFIPLSRLSYCVYLIHPAVIYYVYAGMEEHLHFSITLISTLYAGKECWKYTRPYGQGYHFNQAIKTIWKPIWKSFTNIMDMPIAINRQYYSACHELMRRHMTFLRILEVSGLFRRATVEESICLLVGSPISDKFVNRIQWNRIEFLSIYGISYKCLCKILKYCVNSEKLGTLTLCPGRRGTDTNTCYRPTWCWYRCFANL